MQHSISLKGLPVPSANGFFIFLLGSKSPFPDIADIGQKDNFALNCSELKVKDNRQTGEDYWTEILDSLDN